MAVVNVPITDTFNQWREKTNEVASNVGDLDELTTVDKTNIVAAVNETKEDLTGFSIAMSIALG